MSSRTPHNLHSANSGSLTPDSNSNNVPSGSHTPSSPANEDDSGRRGHPNVRKHQRAATDHEYNPSNADQSDEAEIDPRAYKIPKVEAEQLLQSKGKKDKKDIPISLPVDEIVLETAKAAVRLSRFDYKDIFDDKGYTALGDAVWAETRKVGHPFFSKKHKKLVKPKAWRKAAVNILASSPRPLLKAVFDGQLPRKILSESNLVQELFNLFDTTDEDQANHDTWSLRQHAKFAPNIYARFHVDKTGCAMEPVRLRMVIKRIREYVSGDPTFHDQNAVIDGQTRGKNDRDRIEKGLHHHLNGSHDRVEAALTFCFALETFLDGVAPSGSIEENCPLDRALTYFGFSVCFVDRIKQHSNGNTNWLGALFNDICKTLFTDEDGTPEFSFQTWVIAYLTSYEECQIGEELFARAGCGYYYTGQGFNIAPAGIAVTSASLEDHSFAVATKLWKTCFKFRTKDPGFESNREEEKGVYLPIYTELGKTAGRQDENEQLRKNKREEQRRELLDLREKCKAAKEAMMPRAVFQQQYRDFQEELRLAQIKYHLFPHLLAMYTAIYRQIMSELQPIFDEYCRSSPEL